MSLAREYTGSSFRTCVYRAASRDEGLPALFATFDVAMIPFVMNALIVRDESY